MQMWRAFALMIAGAGIAIAGLSGWQSLKGDAAGNSDAVVIARPAPEFGRDPAAEASLAMDAATRKRLGVKTQTMTPVSIAAVSNGFARVLDVGPLAAIDSEIQSAQAAATASAADAARLAGLARNDQSASARSVQVATAQAIADRQRIGLARRRLGLEFGPGLAALPDQARRAMIGDVAAGRAALVRIDLPGAARIRHVAVGDPPRAVRLLGAAAVVDPRLQGQSLLAVWQGPTASQPAAGRLLPAQVDAMTRQSGVIVPRSALLRQNGVMFVYVSNGAGFARSIIGDGRPVPDGWFTVTGVKPGTAVVTAGAGAVLAAEVGAAAGEAQ